MVASSLQSRRNFGGRVLSIFLTNIMAAIFDLNGSGRLGERRKFVPKGRSSVKNKERGRGWEVKIFALRPPPTPTVHSNSKSNIAGRINDCELLTLARTSKTPVLQARWLALRVELWDWGRSKRHSFQSSGRCTSRRVTVCLVAGYFLFFFFFRAAARVVKLASIRKVRKRACTENENQNPRGPLVLSHHGPRSSCRSTN